MSITQELVYDVTDIFLKSKSLAFAKAFFLLCGQDLQVSLGLASDWRYDMSKSLDLSELPPILNNEDVFTV